MRHLLLAGASLLAIAIAGSRADATVFNYSGTIIDYVIPTTGTYDVTAIGAQGGAGTVGSMGYSGGRGAEIGGLLWLTAGTDLRIAVGGAGASGNSNGGGGGGSFVVTADGTPLVIAGGGGGVRTEMRQNGFDASIGRSGLSGSGGNAYGSGGGIATNRVGLGGSVSFNSTGSGGGGFFGNGANDFYTYAGVASLFGTGGASWANGLAGGVAIDECPPGSGITGGGNGGFGGGGAGAGCFGGGGGGGYSGGDGGFVAGGGGSYLSAAATRALYLSGVGYGNGFVSITDVPEPGGAGLLTAALVAIGAIRRRGRGA